MVRPAANRPFTTVRDGVLDEIVEMPSESPWPVTLALCAALGFTMVLTTHYVTAGIFALLAAVVLAAWHSNEPEDA